MTMTGPSSIKCNSSNRNFLDDDPGIMSEVETSATGNNFKRSSRLRSSLPIVRSSGGASSVAASRINGLSQERSLGLVFLQFRTETKRALLPNEITSMDTVRALFVRSFPRVLTMNYLGSSNVRIYVHDPNKDTFYELEDLREVRDRSVLRIYEQDLENGTWQPVGGQRPEHPRLLNQQVNQELLAAASGRRSVQPTTGQSSSGQSYAASRPVSWMINDDPSYFSEPEFESGMTGGVDQQHMHRSRRERASFSAGRSSHASSSGPSSLPVQVIDSSSQSQYYGTIIIPAYRTAAIMQQNQQQIQQQQEAPRPPERASKAFSPGMNRMQLV